jgi:hypothetical protein
VTDNSSRYARLAKRGDVVIVKTPGNEDREAVVRDVDMILHMADGADHVVPADSEIEIVAVELPDDLEEQVESISEDRLAKRQNDVAEMHDAAAAKHAAGKAKIKSKPEIPR